MTIEQDFIVAIEECNKADEELYETFRKYEAAGKRKNEADTHLRNIEVRMKNHLTKGEE